MLGSHGPTLNVYIAKMTDAPACPPHCCSALQRPWPAATAPPHRYTQGPHFFATHRRKLVIVVTQYRCVWTRLVQIRTAGSFRRLFLSLYPRWKQFGSAGVCILHMSAFIVLWTLFVFEFGTFGILYISRQEVGVGGAADWEISSLTLWRPLTVVKCSDVV